MKRLSSRQPAIGAFFFFLLSSMCSSGAQVDISGPAGSVQFGTAVLVLPNGNFVVTDPVGPISNVGAVYLYSPSGTLISTLTGSTANDQVGIGGVFLVGSGNFVVVSNVWDQGKGAATWVSGVSGLTGVVSAANSLVGSTSGDFVGGASGVTLLSDGSVRSPNWRNGAAIEAGAVTWAGGASGIAGVVSPSNSLVGTTTGDRVGNGGVTPLANGNYVVSSSDWNNGPAGDAGAVTWVSGDSGVVGAVSPSNSLVGTSGNDRISVLRALVNGHYVAGSWEWDNGALVDVGAVTWCNGAMGRSGVVSPSNSLIGLRSGDAVGLPGPILPLANGHYVVHSRQWDNGTVVNAGAVTWANGNQTTSAVVSMANSLVGTTADDNVGDRIATALTNGNYVVASPAWDNGAMDAAGAATWCSGVGGCSGAVTSLNSLIGSTAGDHLGSVGVTALSNGHYVVASALWDRNTTINAGAATWANGTTGLVGIVSLANSLVGSATDDFVSSGGITALANSNYVAVSPEWNNGLSFDVGAATWGNGATGIIGTPLFNSLIGSSAGDRVGGSGVRALADGNYVIASSRWDNNTLVDVGAVTWANGGKASAGGVDTDNSLVGALAEDRVGLGGVTSLSDGRYLIFSGLRDNGSILNAGAITLARSAPGLVGTVSSSNSVVGTLTNDINSLQRSAYDVARQRLIVGRPLQNLVTLFTLPSEFLFANGFE